MVAGPDYASRGPGEGINISGLGSAAEQIEARDSPNPGHHP